MIRSIYHTEDSCVSFQWCVDGLLMWQLFFWHSEWMIFCKRSLKSIVLHMQIMYQFKFECSSFQNFDRNKLASSHCFVVLHVHFIWCLLWSVLGAATASFRRIFSCLILPNSSTLFWCLKSFILVPLKQMMLSFAEDQTEISLNRCVIHC